MSIHLLISGNKLKEPVIELYRDLHGFDPAIMKRIRIGPGASPRSNAEAWNENQIRYNPEAHRDKGDHELSWWLATLAHEVRHCIQFSESPLPAFMNRFFNWIDRTRKGHDNSAWEKEAISSGMKTLSFSISNEDRLRELFNLADEKQILAGLTPLVSNYKALLAKRQNRDNTGESSASGTEA